MAIEIHLRALALYLLFSGTTFWFLAAAQQECEVLSPCQLLCDGTCGMEARTGRARRLEGPGASQMWEDVTPARSRSAPGEKAAPETMDELIKRVVGVAEAQAAATCNSVNPAVHGYPQAVEASGAWKLVPPGDWTSGFFPGVLWQLHSLTGKAAWAAQAQMWQAGLAGHQRDWWTQHDFGFVYLPSFAHSYTVTGSPADLRQALAAAEALAWAYNPATRSLRTFEGWDPTHNSGGFRQVVIMDFMMNIPLLVWGAKQSGPPRECDSLRMDRDPATTWMDMAVSHARQVAANHLRPDGTSFHIVEYQPVLGEVNKRYTYQGYADNSTWARGQSWAIAGFAIMHKETGLPEFLEVGKKVADAWLQLLVKQELPLAGQFVPKWDFNAPYDPTNDGPRDSAAAAVAALGLLHLAEALPGSDCGQKYLCAAVNTLRELASDKYLVRPGEPGFPALLKHATGNAPLKVQLDTGLVYGDYYFLSALAKCASMDACRLYGQRQTGRRRRQH